MTKRKPMGGADVYFRPRGVPSPKGIDPSPRRLYGACPICGEYELQVEIIPGPRRRAIVSCARCNMQRSVRTSPGETEVDIMRHLVESLK
jgi:transcription elongation factor Elf1